MSTIRRFSKRALLGMASSFALAMLLPVSGFAIEDEASNAITSNGITVEFAARAVGQDGDRATIMAGEDVELRFKLTNSATGAAISDTRAAVWVDSRKKTGFMIPTSEKVDPCREKISSFLQGGLSYQPDIDLNAWYILALNNKASISVIDPLRGYGSQRVVTLIGLNSPGVDWVMARCRRPTKSPSSTPRPGRSPPISKSATIRCASPSKGTGDICGLAMTVA